MTPADPQPANLWPRSQEAFAKAKMLMPGGVSSPVRAYKAVGGQPVFAASGKGAYVTDLDGRKYVDYVMSYGPLILGHTPRMVVEAVIDAAMRGASFGMPTEGEIALAQLVIAAMPSVERVRFVNSGTEATMSAIRLARAATSRPKIIKCVGCYHGHSDSLLVQAGSGATTLGVPSSPGVPASITSQTVLVPYNDLDAVARAMTEHQGQIAAMLIEPIAGNIGTIPPAGGYLQGLRKLCDQHGAVLIFDEVMTGFRVAKGGAQELYDVAADLTCMGKVMGGGLPCAAYGGKASLMQQVAPEGPMYQAGTLSGNPLAMAAGIATLTALADGTVYRVLEQQAAKLERGLAQAARDAGVPVAVQRVGSMMTCFFTNQPVRNNDDAMRCDTRAFGVFFRAMLERGVMLPPSQFETWFVSTAHDDSALDHTLNAAGLAMQAVAECKA
ncbi:MAG: glutamate-1-semialdehyde 2,1-aminomutase [Phycisphaeraceae bacterium]|nr:glutamate-1-semialdehyde 2,1-aminomutase [Phycisphaeraceae bacterium]